MKRFGKFLLSVLFSMLIIFGFYKVAQAQSSFYIERVEEAEVSIKTFEDDEVIIEAELPAEIELRAEALDDREGFYRVWFVEDEEEVEYDALVKVTFKNLTEGRIVKIDDAGVETDVTDGEAEGQLVSIWFECKG